jgi:hypothetical protein
MFKNFESRNLARSAVTNNVERVLKQAHIHYDEYPANDDIFQKVFVFKKQPIDGTLIRVYRGLVKSDESILEQLPYALRKIDTNSDKFDQKKFEELKIAVTNLAINLSYASFLKYVEAVRPLLQSDETVHLDQDLKKIEDRVILGNPISEIITQVQFLHVRGSSHSAVSPFVSATTDPHEAAKYGNLVMVLDLPVSLVSQIAGPRHGEVMLRGVIEQKYITACLTKYDKPFSVGEKLNNGIDKALAVLAEHDDTQIYSEKEALAIRKKQHNKELSGRKKQYENDLAFVLSHRKEIANK